ncbi:DnaJ domain-containing protein [Pseudomonas luteola]|uniref:DnaJ domain-containing protein n=1 Tax=Pseudomonas TaxID=286 RepID=UPI0002D61045|nr:MULTISPECIES: DnaJ domain-containing protein [Pseudomonas]
MFWPWPLTLSGALTGWAAADLSGALLGAMLGHAAERKLGLTSWSALRLRLGQVGFEHQLLFELLGHLAKAGGQVSTAHIRQAEGEIQRLGLDVEGRRRAIAAFNQGKTAVRSARTRLAAAESQAEIIIRACWRMVWVNGSVRPGERDLIRQWGLWAGLSQTRVDELQPMRSAKKPRANNGYKEALALLGVSESSDSKSIKQAYRRLLSRHHPDKVQGAGANKYVVQEAAEKTAALHAAYRLIKERHGFR